MINCRTLAALTAVMSVVSVAGLSFDAHATGLSVARFGGEHGNPTAINPTSLYYNPGGFGFSSGTKLTIDVNLALRSFTYERPESALDDSTRATSGTDGGNVGENEVNNLILQPMLGVTTDFHVDSPVKFGLAFFAPFGGQAVWEKVDGDPRYPGAEDGPQRWYAIDGTIRTLALAAGLAYVIEPIDLSIGITGNLYLNEVHTIRARNADGTDNLVTSADTLKEGRSELEADSTDYGLGVGVLWQVIPRELWIGASWQSAPNFDGEVEMEGELTNVLAAGAPEAPNDVKFRHYLPDVYRFGIRYRPMPKLELRLFGDYTRWSVLEQQCLFGADVSDPDTACETGSDGSQTDPNAETVIQVFQRRWEDGFGVRLGASYQLTPALEGIFGLGYDGNAVPDETLDPALVDMDDVSISLGARFEIFEGILLMLTATEILYFERDTTDSVGNEGFSAPSRQPANKGIYNQNIFLVNTNLEFRF